MQNVVCTGIEKSPPNWNFWRKVIDRNKYFHFNDEFPNTVYFCNSLTSPRININIEILGRIGSDSADGEVYNIRYRNIEFAMKIMPRIDKNSEAKNLNEIKIASEASKYLEYFPKVFATGFCDNSSFYSSETGQISHFVKKAIEYHQYNIIYSHIKNKREQKRFDSEYRNGIDLDALKVKYVNYNIDNTNLIEVDFLISELANGDLGNWMKINHSNEEWKKVLLDIITGTYYMSVMLKIVHPDLHPGNILICNNNNNIQALIHDFGRCYPIDDTAPNTYKSSLISFCSEFVSCSYRNDLDIPRNILIVIQDILAIVKRNYIGVGNIKSFYEDIIFPIVLNI